ncbi:MAG: T9SS type A sorting domain-containing protein [Chitinophagaceae bacterium]
MRAKKSRPALLLLLLFAYAGTTHAQCISTGWQNATSFSTDNITGVYDFSIPANAQVSDNARSSAASLIAILTGNTYYLEAKNFGFTIPSYSSICGISVEIESRATGLLLTAAVRDNEVKIIKNGTITGNNKALPGDWTSTDTYKSYGGASDLWGTTLTPADVNSSGFGIAISVRIIALVAALPSAEIDHIRMKIDYNPILPVTLEYFTVKKNNNTALIEWKTTEEEPGAVINLQRKAGQGEWETRRSYPLLSISSGNTYNVTDTLSNASVYQYRLQTVLRSGQPDYSSIRSIRTGADEYRAVMIYPNPATDKITVNMQNISVTDVFGQRIVLPVYKKDNTSIITISGLPPGIYLLSDGIRTGRFVKQ